MSIADRVLKMSESATLKMASLAQSLKEEGKAIISLSLGEPDFNTPDYIKEAAIQAIKDNHTYYPPVPGYPDVKDAIIEKFKRDNELTYNRSQIVVSTGAKHSLMNLVLALVNPGDEVILPTPYWVSYDAMVEFAEGVKVEIKTDIEADFKITPEQLEKAITAKTKLFIFSNPCNPSGSIYSKDELYALGEVFKRHPHVYIISDEIYELINFSGENTSIASIKELFPRVITVNGLAKGFAMTGWRIGYIGASEEIATACTKLQGQFTSGANSIAQKATIAALMTPYDEVEKMKGIFKHRRDLFIDKLKEIEGLKLNKPEGAFYLFPDVSFYFGKSFAEHKVENADDLAMYLLADAQVATTPGDAFGNPDNLRLSYANSDEQLIEAARRIKVSLAKLS